METESTKIIGNEKIEGAEANADTATLLKNSNELTLTDHLNKKLLESYLYNVKQSPSNLINNLQHLDISEDSNAGNENDWKP